MEMSTSVTHLCMEFHGNSFFGPRRAAVNGDEQLVRWRRLLVFGCWFLVRVVNAKRLGFGNRGCVVLCYSRFQKTGGK